MGDAKRVNTPDGPGVQLEWPTKGSKQFRERIDSTGFELVTGEIVNVTPVLLDSGEVRFYAEHSLR